MTRTIGFLIFPGFMLLDATADLEGGDGAGRVEQHEAGEDQEAYRAGHGLKRGKNVISARR